MVKDWLRACDCLAGELLKQIEPATGKNNQYAQVKGGDAPTFHSRKQVASDAGMGRACKGPIRPPIDGVCALSV